MHGFRRLPVRRACLLLALVTAALPACRRATTPAPLADATAAPLLEEESQLARYLRLSAPELGSSRSDITARLGVPDSVRAMTVSNRHDPTVTDSVFTLFYDGIAAVVYRAGYDGKEILAAVEISDGRHLPEDAPFGIGASAAEVVALLGEPDSAAADLLEFTCEECMIAGHETVRFALRGGRVTRIELQYWID